MSTRAKVVTALAIIAGVIVIGVILLALFFPGDLVRDRAVAAMESSLDRPVHVGGVGLSLFPPLGAKLTDVRIGERAEPGRPRIAVESISLRVRVWPLLRRQVEIKSVEIEGLDLDVRLGDAKAAAAKGEIPGVRKAGEADTTSGRTLYFVVEDLKLIEGRVSVTKEDGGPFVELGGISEELNADATSAGDLRLAGKTTIDSIRVHLPSGELGRGMRLTLAKSLRYNRSSDSLMVETADVDLSGLPVSLSGAASGVTSGRPIVDLKIEGGPAEVSNILGYLPVAMFPQMKGVESKGTVSLRGTVRGPVGGETAARGGELDYRLTLDLSNGRIVHPELPEPIESLGLRASVNPIAIEITDLEMKSGTSSAKARARVTDYKAAPRVDADIDADVDLAIYSAMLSEKDAPQISGRTVAQLKLRGPVKDVAKLDVSGTVDLNSVRVAFPDGQPPVENLQGRISIVDKGLTVQSLSGNVGSSDFSVKGTLTNYPALLPESGAKVPARVDLDLRSGLLALDELRSEDEGEGEGSKGKKPGEAGAGSAEKTAGLLGALTGKIQISADKVRTKELETGQVTGTATIDRGLITIERLDVEAFQGNAALQGTVDYRDPEDAKLDLEMQVEQARLSDLMASSNAIKSFSKMGGFLTGRVDASATLAADLKETQGLDLGTVTSIGNLSIQSAEMVNHPIQTHLANYFEAPELNTLIISEWFQPFKIEDGRLYVEKLSIRAKQVELTASGWQSLDGKVNMSLDVLLPRELSDGLRKRVPTELAPVLFGGDSSRILAPVKLTGSYDSPSVALDTDRLTSQAQEQAKKRMAEERKRLEEQTKSKAKGFLQGLFKDKSDTSSKK